MSSLPLFANAGFTLAIALSLSSICCSRNEEALYSIARPSSASRLEEEIASAALKNTPTDPGAAGRKTLQGIDSDGDGIRDDLERWIRYRFPNSPRKQAALSQFAKAYQRSLIEASENPITVIGAPMAMSSPKASRGAMGEYTASALAPHDQLEKVRKARSQQSSRELLKAQECVEAIVGNPTSLEIPHLDELRALVRNTPERAAAALKGDRDFSGQTYSAAQTREESLKNCRFDVQSLKDE